MIYNIKQICLYADYCGLFIG